MTKKIGFVGLGTMGSIMAKRLLIYGYSLNVWNRTRDKCDSLVNMGASISSSPAEIAEICDVVFTMTTDSNASKEVILGKNGVLAEQMNMSWLLIFPPNGVNIDCILHGLKT